jgi:hypothetical protein
MEAARTSETSVDNYFTRQYIPEDESELHTRRRRENLKSHSVLKVTHIGFLLRTRSKCAYRFSIYNNVRYFCDSCHEVHYWLRMRYVGLKLSR